jgi:hypothetical protein
METKKEKEQELHCYEITLDHKAWVLEGHPTKVYIQSESAAKACEIAQKKKYWQHEIKGCKLLGKAMVE